MSQSAVVQKPKSRLDLAKESLDAIDAQAGGSKVAQAKERLSALDSEEAAPAAEVKGGGKAEGKLTPEERNVLEKAISKKVGDAMHHIDDSMGFRNKAKKLAGLGKEFVSGAVGSVPDTGIMALNAGIGATNFDREQRYAMGQRMGAPSVMDEEGRMTGGGVDATSLPGSMQAGGSFADNLKGAQRAHAMSEVTGGQGYMHGIDDQAPTSLPHAPYVADIVSREADAFTNGFTHVPEDAGPYATAARAAGGMFGPGYIAKHFASSVREQIAKHVPSLAPEEVASVTEKVLAGLGFLGSAKPSSVAGAAVAGGVSHAMNEDGTNPALALGAGLAAGSGVGGVASWLGRGGPKGLTYKAVGLGPKQIDLKAFDAAQNLGVEIPNSVVARNSPSTRIAEQIAARFPFVGPKVRERLDRANEQFVASWDKVKERVGPRMADVADDLAERYVKLERSVPDAARVSAKPLLDEINALRKKLDVDSPSGPTAAVFSKLKEMKDGILKEMPEGFEKYPEAAQVKFLSELGYPIKRLINQEKETNRFLRDKNVFDRVHDKDTLMLMQGLPKRIESVLSDYGKANKEFGSLYKSTKADYARSARREELEHLLTNMVKDPIKDEPRYGPLARALGDEKNQKKLKRILGSDFDLVKDFQTYAKSMSKWSASNPNPSGTASTGSVLGSAKWFIGAIGSGTWVFGFWKAAMGGAGAGLVAHFLTDRKFLENAVAYAKSPTAVRERSFWEAAAQASGIAVSDLKAMASSGMELEATQKEAERESRINDRKQRRSNQKGD